MIRRIKPQMNKILCKKSGKLIITVLLFVVIMIIALKLRTVGYVSGNMLYYKSDVYAEVDAPRPFTGFGMSLGKVDVDGEKCDLLSLKGHPQYLHVSFGWDGRDYKKVK